jgi:predicted dehydrogenase
MKGNDLGIAVIGAGRIGTLRASLAAAHPAVRFLAVSDLDGARARALADKVGAQFSSADNLEVITRPEVNTVIVSTSEKEHALPVLQALEQGKSVLVEKPIAMTLEDADRMIHKAKEMKADFRIGYTRRFQRQNLLAKEHIIAGRLGKILGGAGRVYNARAQAFQILKRSPDATWVLDVLTYYVDLFCWFLEGNLPVEAVARGQAGIFRAAGYKTEDVTWAILTFSDGAVINLGIFFGLPERYPTLGDSARLEILGTEGALIYDDDHKEQILYTDRGIPHSYVPGHSVNMAFVKSASYGEWALGDLWGPIANETRSWLDHLSTGKPCHLATPEDARRNLEVTLAIEQSVQTRRAIALPMADQ